MKESTKPLFSGETASTADDVKTKPILAGGFAKNIGLFQTTKFARCLQIEFAERAQRDANTDRTLGIAP